MLDEMVSRYTSFRDYMEMAAAMAGGYIPTIAQPDLAVELELLGHQTHRRPGNLTERGRAATTDGVIWTVRSEGPWDVTVQCRARSSAAALRVAEAEHPGVLWRGPTRA